MGKGDLKTAKGKRYNSSYGNVRPHAVGKVTGSVSAATAKKTASKAAVRKVVAKKAPAK